MLVAACEESAVSLSGDYVTDLESVNITSIPMGSDAQFKCSVCRCSMTETAAVKIRLDKLFMCCYESIGPNLQDKYIQWDLNIKVTQ